MDTNVLVSAFLKPRSAPARILRLLIQGDLEIVINQDIVSEYSEVLARPKFELDQERIRIVLDLIRSTGISAPSLPQSFHLPDPSDEPFLEAALACRADVLITGNKKHFPKRSCKGVKIASPTEFLKELSNR
jgi:putative PIN family toxin of toxin-antitoxin system